MASEHAAVGPGEQPEGPPPGPTAPPKLFLQDGRLDLRCLDREGLEAWLVAQGEKRFRALQLYKWLWQRGVSDFAAMTDISQQTRARLAEVATASQLRPQARLQSEDGTVKYLWTLHDGSTIESVLIPDADRDGPPRLTLCVSTQVGCAMACSFCLTGDLGLKRHLSPAEIALQPLTVQAELPAGTRITNLVMMGMGEPLHNYDNLLPALRVLLDEDGQNFSHRRITVSTVGLVPAMKRLSEALPVNIAVSLNATTEAQRRAVMPITRRYSMAELMAACRELPLPRAKRITFEYVMMAGFNDSMEDAKRLVGLMHGVRAKVNLIPYNENPERDIRRPSPERVKEFQDYLVRRRVHCSVRATRGRDISAACGQLGKAAELMAGRLSAAEAPVGAR
jgi:23S rRNA (adenine2503-C2)-methyltransferase